MKKSIKVLAILVITLLACTTFTKGQSVYINEDDFETKVLKADKPVVVVFTDTTHHEMAKAVRENQILMYEVANNHKDEFMLYCVHIHENMGLVNRYNLRDPSTIFFKEGEEIGPRAWHILQIPNFIRILKQLKFIKR